MALVALIALGLLTHFSGGIQNIWNSANQTLASGSSATSGQPGGAQPSSAQPGSQRVPRRTIPSPSRTDSDAPTVRLSARRSSRDHNRWDMKAPAFAAVILVAIGTVRILTTFQVFNHTIDEPDQLAAGIEYLSTGRYLYEDEHPPLARVFGALGPFLAGERWRAGPNSYQEGYRILGSATTTTGRWPSDARAFCRSFGSLRWSCISGDIAPEDRPRRYSPHGFSSIPFTWPIPTNSRATGRNGFWSIRTWTGASLYLHRRRHPAGQAAPLRWRSCRLTGRTRWRDMRSLS